MMMFYNGFNLLIDLVLAGVVGWLAYRAGWFAGYGAGETDTLEYGERYGEYLHEQEREREH